MTETREWLERVYGQSPGYFAVTVFAGGKPRRTKWFATDELDAAARTIIATSKRGDVYVSVGTHDAPADDPKSRGGEKSVLSIPGFWADIDIGELGHKPAALPNPSDEEAALSIVADLPEPSLVLHSGGGFQLLWLFDQPWVFAEPTDKITAKRASLEWHNLLEQRGRALGLHVDKVGNLDRILRVPGTANHKTGEQRPVTVRQLNGPAMPLPDLAALGLPDDEPIHSTVDDFPLTWEEILTPHGWTFCGDNRWARPGKPCSEGHSATTDPYNVPVLVNFSATDILPSGPGQRLTKLRVWAHLNYAGDMKRARAALHKLVKSTPEDWAHVAARFVSTRIDWRTLWTEEEADPVWLLEPLIEKGRQVAIYSEAKAGKSLVTLEMVLAGSFGENWPRDREHLKDRYPNPKKQPIEVLYIDLENSKQDIRMRAAHMGYEGEIPEHLHYYSFPMLAWLDTEQGGEELYALAKYHGADLVVIDTLSRVVEGEENANDTYNEFYKHTGVRLKADGISLLRLDHSGKDRSKGMRGASSKTTDVDEIWQLLSEGDAVSLIKTHSRSHNGADHMVLVRRDDPVLHHSYDAPTTTDEIEVWLDLLGVAPDVNRDPLWEAVKDEATVQGYSRNKVWAAQLQRRERVK